MRIMNSSILHETDSEINVQMISYFIIGYLCITSDVTYWLHFTFKPSNTKNILDVWGYQKKTIH